MSTSPIAEAVDQEEIRVARIPWWLLKIRRKFRLKSRTPMPSDSTPEGYEQETPERGFWNSQLEFLLSLLGLSVGLGNIWRFPWVVWRNGGGAFLIPYTVMLFFCGLPLFLMELTIGQYSGCGPASVFNIAPIFQGLGWCVLANSVMGNIYYITVIAWSLFYLFASLTKTLPWIGCSNWWNSEACFSRQEKIQCEDLSVHANVSLYYKRVCIANTTTNWKLYLAQSPEDRVSPAQEYFNRKMYRLFHEDNTLKTIEHPGWPNTDLLGCLTLAWIITFLCVSRGIKSSGKVVYFTALFPYVALIGLVYVATQLDGAAEGIHFYLYPNNTATKLQEPQAWVDAAAQIFYSLGISGGAVMTYASYNRYNNNILRDCLIVGIGNSLTSLLAGIPIFAVLGYMAKELGVPVSEAVHSGSALAFIAYPEVVSTLPGAPVWSAIFFIMLITLGLDSQFGGVETLMTAIMDRHPKLIRRKTWVALTISVVSLLLGFSTIVDAGVYWEELLNYYAGWGVVILSIFNCFVYSWVYGAGKIIDHLQHMINRKFPKSLVWVLLFLWKGVCPIMIIVISIFNCIDVTPIAYHGYTLPWWAQGVGWMVALIPLVLIPIGAIYVYVKDVKSNQYSAEPCLARLRRLTRPTALWLPSYLKHEHSVAHIPTIDSGTRQHNPTASLNMDRSSYGSNGSNHVITTPSIIQTDPAGNSVT